VQAYAEEVHACCKSNDIREANDALTLEELTWHHGVASEFRFVHNPSSDECETGQHGTENVSRFPGVGIAA
jgi:hypothetical protein